MTAAERQALTLKLDPHRAATAVDVSQAMACTPTHAVMPDPDQGEGVYSVVSRATGVRTVGAYSLDRALRIMRDLQP